MTKAEAITVLNRLNYVYVGNELFEAEKEQALDTAIEALKAQDRPIICPRCGRTFAESEGRE